MFELESSAYPHKTLQLVQSECWKRIYLTGVNHILLFLILCDFKNMYGTVYCNV